MSHYRYIPSGNQPSRPQRVRGDRPWNQPQRARKTHPVLRKWLFRITLFVLGIVFWQHIIGLMILLFVPFCIACQFRDRYAGARRRTRGRQTTQAVDPRHPYDNV